MSFQAPLNPTEELAALLDSTTNSINVNLNSTTTIATANAIAIPTKLSNTPTPTGLTRSLNTIFQIDLNHPTLVMYTVELTVLLNSVTVQLLIGTINPPTNPQGEGKLSLSLLGLTGVQRQQIVGWVPAGSFVELLVGGTGGVATLQNSFELVYL